MIDRITCEIMQKCREKMRDNPKWKARRLRFLVGTNFTKDEVKHHVHLKTE